MEYALAAASHGYILITHMNERTSLNNIKMVLETIS
jgi:hypothetical protein